MVNEAGRRMGRRKVGCSREYYGIDERRVERKRESQRERAKEKD
jgi:hypothetical protein